MEEIANNIYIDRSFPGVVLGVLKLKHGLLMVDTPFRGKDQHSWRAKVNNLGGGVDKLLVMLDTHIDRTLGIHAMEYSVLGHKNAVEILKNRPTTLHAQDIETGADWEPYKLPTSVQWTLPNMTYTDDVYIYWDVEPIKVSHQPGAHWAGSWLIYEAEKVVFVGDSVVLDQPPFLAWSNIDLWLEELAWLGSDSFKGYKIVSGRNGVIRSESIESLMNILSKTKEIVEDLSKKDDLVDEINIAVTDLMDAFDSNQALNDLYKNRLMWGLAHYIQRHYPDTEADSKGETE